MNAPSAVPRRTLQFCMLVVALSVASLPLVAGHLTVLMGTVVLFAAALREAIAPQQLAFDYPPLFLLFWPVAAALNVFLFSIIAVPVYFLLRRRSVAASVVVLVSWLVLYLSFLLFLF